MRYLARDRCWITLLVLPVVCGVPHRSEGNEPAISAGLVQFEAKIRPVLAAKCVKCHGEDKQESGLRLDSRSAMLRGGDSGPAIVPGKPDESLLIEAIRYEGLEMPPTGPLDPQVTREFALWIGANAPWPSANQPIREALPQITPADRQWWAFQPLHQPTIPRHVNDDWSINPIDRFVYRRLSDHGLQPAPRADKVTLVRRLYFDLIGLPPTPEEIDAFVVDNSADAWERLIDRLLEDERYGEHWARYWLDIVRYSESDGWNQDAFRPHIWRYRDYVVQSFNADKPYPDFVLEQLAGDEIAADNPSHLAAAGYLRLGIYEYNQRDARNHWRDIINELTDVTGDVFLGMGLACARCHDHKFDPILRRDYFKLRAFFEPLCWRDDLPAATEAQQSAHQRQLAVWRDATQDIRAQIAALLKPYEDRKWKSTVDKFPLDIQACFHKPVTDRSSWDHQMAYLVSRQYLEEGGGPFKNMTKEDQERHEQLKQKLAAFDELKPAPLPKLMTVSDFSGTISPTIIPDDPLGQEVVPGFLSVLCDSTDQSAEILPLPHSTGRRTALARWIGRPDNPLTTRVIVNRIWQQHFGRGIVRTANNFGRTGQLPTHPDLLDWLTVDFVQTGWSFKRLHKLILTSEVWRQSAHHPQASHYQAVDPDENLMWRAAIRRLTAEQIRDAMLSVSGELWPLMGGPCVDEQTPRRALYIKRLRNSTDTFLHAFDVANGLKSVAERDTTTTPTQALLMINGEYGLERARRFAARLDNLPLDDPAAIVRYAIRLAWGREPSAAELQRSLSYLDTRPDAACDAEKLVDFCHVLFNSNEFLYLD